MKRVLLGMLMMVSTSAMASQMIYCQPGTSSGAAQDWARLTIEGAQGKLVSNVNEQPNNDLIDEVVTVDSRSAEAQYLDVVYVSANVSGNDTDFNYKAAFSKQVLGRNASNVTLYVYAKSFMPGENGSSYSTEFKGCTSMVR